MNKIILFCITFFSSLVFAESVSIPNEVMNELQKFQSHGQTLSANAVQEFPLRVHQIILERQKAFFEGLNGQCRDTIKITFGSQVLDSDESAVKEFESGLVRVEASKCFENVAPINLIRISEDPNFKRKAFSTLRQITQQENLTCETTSAPSIGNSNYCYLGYDMEKSDQVASHVNFLTFNNYAPKFNAPVYFREAFVSARRMGSKTLYYALSYVRASKLSSFQRFFAKDYIAKVQNEVFAELENSALNTNAN